MPLNEANTSFRQLSLGLKYQGRLRPWSSWHEVLFLFGRWLYGGFGWLGSRLGRWLCYRLFAGNSCFEGRARRELRYGSRRDLKNFTRLRILAHPCSTFGRLERTKTNQGDVMPLGNGLGDDCDQCVD